MATYTLDELVNGVHDTLAAAASLVRDQSQAEDEITEGIPPGDMPLLQTWIFSNQGTDFTGDTDRVTLSGKHSIKEYLVHSDLYIAQRAHVAQAMGALLVTLNEFGDILDTQSYHTGDGIFGLSFVTSFRWRWEHVTFDYGGVLYAGARFYITLRCGTTV